MAEMCPDCDAWFGSAAELAQHVQSAHGGGDPNATLAMNPESHKAGLVCALCGARFRTREQLAQHNLAPHYRSNRPVTPTPGAYTLI